MAPELCQHWRTTSGLKSSRCHKLFANGFLTDLKAAAVGASRFNCIRWKDIYMDGAKGHGTRFINGPIIQSDVSEVQRSEEIHRLQFTTKFSTGHAVEKWSAHMGRSILELFL